MKNLIKKARDMHDGNYFQTRSAFSLVEILVVIVVIGLLFMFFVPRIDFAGDKARETGVKSDFRSFSLAAEQLLRENAGFSKHETVAKMFATNSGANLYLDPAMLFSDTGICNQEDPWNQPYTVQIVGTTAGKNNGGMIFMSGGKDGKLDGVNDYTIGIVFVDGVISTATFGFSSNIESDLLTDITSGTTGTFTLTTGEVKMVYKK